MSALATKLYMFHIHLPSFLLSLSLSPSLSLRSSKQNGKKLLLPPRTNGNAGPSFLGPSDPGIVPLIETKSPRGFANPHVPAVHSNSKKVYIRDFVAYSQDMQDDSGYKFSDEYEVRTSLLFLESFPSRGHGRKWGGGVW